MHKFPLGTVSLCLLLAYHLHSGEGLKCYVCRSDINANCTSKNIHSNYSVECPSRNGRTAILCRKIHQKLRFKNEDAFTSIRECGYEKGSKDCYKFSYINFAYQETCECAKENCNNGSICWSDVQMIFATFVFLMTVFFTY